MRFCSISLKYYFNIDNTFSYQISPGCSSNWGIYFIAFEPNVVFRKILWSKYSQNSSTMQITVFPSTTVRTHHHFALAIKCPPLCQVGRNGYGYIIPTLKGNLFYILSFTKVNSNADVSPGKERIGDLHSFNFIAHKLFITEFYFTSQVYIAQYDFK